MSEPLCGKCGKVMTPKNARHRPELFLHDECLPYELTPPAPFGEPAKNYGEPWHYYCIPGKLTRDDGTGLIDVVHGKVSLAEPDIDRIVLCVNALAGIPDADLAGLDVRGLLEQNRVLAAALEIVEWKFRPGNGTRCPECHAAKENGHETGCAIESALALVRKGGG